MKRAIWTIPCLFLATWALPAQASVLCVQQTLTKLGYELGVADGIIGAKTRAAAEDFAAKADITLPVVEASNSEEWCKAIRGRSEEADQAFVNGISAEDIDISSPPPGALGPEAQTAYWDMHLTSKSCLDHKPIYGKSPTFALPRRTAAFFSSANPDSIFPRLDRNPACKIKGGQTGRLDEVILTTAPPPPMKGLSADAVRRLSRQYGIQPEEADINIAGYWFAAELTKARLNPLGQHARRLIDTMMTWVEGGALSGRVQQEGSPAVINHSMGQMIATLVNAYADLAPQMTAEERGMIGPWLNAQMMIVAGNSDIFPTQNHNTGWGLNTAVWALAIGDSEALQHAVNRYKLAIHDMRPDGSFPQDSSRGSAGITYNSLGVGNTVLIAALLKSTLGVDLFSYEVDGRSIHTAIEYVLATAEDPVSYNRKYAIECSASDQDHSIDNPITNYGLEKTFSETIYLPVYALLNPDRPAADKILTDRNWGGYDRGFREARFHESLGGAPLCLFALNVPGFEPVELAALPPEPVPVDLSKLETATIQISSFRPAGSSEFRALLRTAIRDGKPGEQQVDFNIAGSYYSDTGKVFSLQFILDSAIGTSRPAALDDCQGRPATVTYDNDPHHFLVLVPADVDGKWTIRDAECLAEALKPKQAFMVKYLANNFTQVATDLVASKQIDTLDSASLAAFIQAVAAGEIVFASGE